MLEDPGRVDLDLGVPPGLAAQPLMAIGPGRIEHIAEHFKSKST